MPEQFKMERTGEWRSSDILFSLTHRPETTRLYIGSSDFKVYSFDVGEEKPDRHVFEGEGHQSYVTGMALVGDRLITGSYDQQLIWWDLNEQKQVRTQSAHDRWIRQVVAMPDGKRVLSVGDDMQCKVWDVESGTMVATFSDHLAITPHNYPSMLYAVAVSEDGNLIATGDRVGHVAIWNAESFEKVGELETPVMYTWDPKARRHSIGGIRSLAFSPDGQQLAVGGIGKIGNIDHLGGPSRLEIFDWGSGEWIHEIEEAKKKGLVEQILYSPDGKTLLTVGGDNSGFINLFNIEQGELLTQESAGGHLHTASADGSFQTLYTAGHNVIERWEITTEELLKAEGSEAEEAT